MYQNKESNMKRKKTQKDNERKNKKHIKIIYQEFLLMHRLADLHPLVNLKWFNNKYFKV